MESAVKGSVEAVHVVVKIDTGNDVSMILKTMREKNIRHHMLPFWYDIDDIHDLNFLQTHLAYLNKKMPI